MGAILFIGIIIVITLAYIVETNNVFNDKSNVIAKVNKVDPVVPQRFLFFDTETTGLLRNRNAPSWSSSNWPHLVQLSWMITNETGDEIKTTTYIIKPVGYKIPKKASDLHGITMEIALNRGVELSYVLRRFRSDFNGVNVVVGHNVDFDLNVVEAEMYRESMGHLVYKPTYCTMELGTPVCRIPKAQGEYKWPSLQELYCHLFGKPYQHAHDAGSDVMATKDCFFEMKRRGYVR